MRSGDNLLGNHTLNQKIEYWTQFSHIDIQKKNCKVLIDDFGVLANKKITKGELFASFGGMDMNLEEVLLLPEIEQNWCIKVVFFQKVF